jgi:hypothetical protein
MWKLVLAVVAILIFVVFVQKSGFVGTINNILNDNYNNQGCSMENRVYPSGKIPGSYLGLTEAERNGLLKDFIMNDRNKIT